MFRLHKRHSALGWMTAAFCLYLSACGGGQGGGNRATGVPVSGKVLHGVVHGGQQPVVGATVNIFQIGTTAYGTGAASLGSTTTAGDGSWNINISCPTGSTLVYVTATGGNAGSGPNSALGLAAALGTCSTASGLTNVNINEVTTVATVYALSQFLDNATASNVGASSTNLTGLGNAFANAGNLVDITTGLSPASLPGSVTTPAATVYSLANLIAACVNSAGGAAGDGSACGALFTDATPAGGTSPTTTLQALLDVARNAGHNVASLYADSGANPAFPGGLASAPNDWTLALLLKGGGLGEPAGIAIDAVGNAWVANWSKDAVSKFAPNGAVLSGAAGYSGGGLHESAGIAIDGAGNVWVTNQQTPSNGGTGGITKLGADGSILSGSSGFTGGGIYFAEAVAIDIGGNVWIANTGGDTLSELKPDGTPISPSSGYGGGGMGNPLSLTIDGSNIWVYSEGTGYVSVLAQATGAPISASGYKIAGSGASGGICGDVATKIWATSYYQNSIVELDGASAGAPQLSPSGGYPTGHSGAERPNACAIDGAGDVWITNYFGNNIASLAGASRASPGAERSGSSGYLSGLVNLPRALAIDASGNVWVAVYGSDAVAVVLGAAAPVKTPVIGVPVKP